MTSTADKKPPNPLGPATSHRDFVSWGIEQVAYVKAGVIDEQAVWTIHAADGTRIGWAPARELALAAVRQNDLEPLSVH
ncbi:MAG: DUF1150 family protein [Rhodospirillales bacterium]|nr:DUF1150 family protein [Rhodospirillales bacterium]